MQSSETLEYTAKNFYRIWKESDRGEDIKEIILGVANRPDYNCREEVEKLINEKIKKVS